MTSEADARTALAEFALPAAAATLSPLGGGHINRSWRVSMEGSGDEYTLQRLNPQVFRAASAVMQNVRAVTHRLGERSRSSGLQALRLVPLRDGRWWHEAPDGALWRLYEFIDGVMVQETPQSPRMAEGAARAFGEFVRLTSDPPLALVDTMPGFHDTRLRLRQLEAALDADIAGRRALVADDCRRILAKRALAALIPEALERGVIARRNAHHDAKLANLLLSAASGEPVCVIDLDTVMPGTPLHDFGDLVRSMASDAAEDAGPEAPVEVRPDFFAAIVRGYLAGTDALLGAVERSLLLPAARAIALEQAARFYADYLNGDVYYRISDPGQNLRRARTQTRLFDSLTRQAATLQDIIARS